MQGAICRGKATIGFEGTFHNPHGSIFLIPINFFGQANLTRFAQMSQNMNTDKSEISLVKYLT